MGNYDICIGIYWNVHRVNYMQIDLRELYTNSCQFDLKGKDVETWQLCLQLVLNNYYYHYFRFFLMISF